MITATTKTILTLLTTHFLKLIVFLLLKGIGLRLKREKCVFLKDKLCYLRYKINKDNLTPIPEKIDAVLNAPTPQNVTELKALLGMLNYYHRFLDRLSTILEPLHKLLT